MKRECWKEELEEAMAWQGFEALYKKKKKEEEEEEEEEVFESLGFRYSTKRLQTLKCVVTKK